MQKGPADVIVIFQLNHEGCKVTPMILYIGRCLLMMENSEMSICCGKEISICRFTAIESSSRLFPLSQISLGSMDVGKYKI